MPGYSRAESDLAVGNPPAGYPGSYNAIQPDDGFSIELLTAAMVARGSTGRFLYSRMDIPSAFAPGTDRGEQKLNSRSANAPNSTFGLTGSPDTWPSGVTVHPLVCVVAEGLTTGGILGRWRPTRPWARPVCHSDAGDQHVFAHMAPVDALNEDISDAWKTQGESNLLRVARRPRRAGLWHYSNDESKKNGSTLASTQLPRNNWVSNIVSPFVRYEGEIPMSLLPAGAGLTQRQLDGAITFTPDMTKIDFFFRTLAVTATLTGALSKIVTFFRTQAVTVTLTPALIKKMFSTMNVTVTLTPALASVKQFPRTFALTITLTPAQVRVFTAFRAVAASVTFTAALTKVASLFRTVAVTVTLTPVQTKISKFFRTSAVTATLTPVFTKFMIAPRSVPVTVTLTPTQTKTAIFPRSIPVAAVISPTLAKTLILSRTFSGALTLTPALTKVKVSPRAFNATVTLIAALTRLAKFPRTVALTVTLTPTLARVSLNKISLAVVVTLTAAQTKIMKAPRSFAVTATLTPTQSVQKLGVLRTRQLDATATFTAAMTKIRKSIISQDVILTITAVVKRKISLTQAVSVVVTPVLSRVLSLRRTFSTSATITPTLTKQAVRPRTLTASAVFATTMTLLRRFVRAFDVPVTFAVTMRRKVFMIMSAIVEFVIDMRRGASASQQFDVPVPVAVEMTKTRIVPQTLAAVFTLIPSMIAGKISSFMLEVTVNFMTGMDWIVARFEGWLDTAMRPARLLSAAMQSLSLRLGLSKPVVFSDTTPEESPLDSTSLKKPRIWRIR